MHRLLAPLAAALTLALTAPAQAGTIGNVYGADGLANIEVGSAKGPRQVDYRFRADASGTLASVTLYFIFSSKPGYNGGNGGDIRITLEGNNAANEPNGIVRGSGLITDPTSGGSFRTVALSGGTVTAGQLYHLRFTNVDPNPTVNWVSLDDLWFRDIPVPREPTIPNLDLGDAYKDPGRGWAQLAHHVPIFTLAYTDGTRHGPGAPYVLARIRTLNVSIGGPNRVAELVTTRSTTTFTGAHFRVQRRAAAPGPLTVALRSASATLRSGMVPAGSISTTGSWANVTFSSPVTVAPGTYRIVAQAPASSSDAYGTWALEQGPRPMFASTRMFTDGFIEWSSTGGASWNSSSNDDAQAYLTTT